MKYDALISVIFVHPEKGGLRKPLSGDEIGFVLSLDPKCNQDNYDCRLYMNETQFQFGSRLQVPIKFAVPDLLANKLKKDLPVYLWAGRVVAVGEIMEVMNDSLESFQ